MPDDDAPDIRLSLRAEAERAPQHSALSPENVRRAQTRRMAVLSASLMGVVLVAVGLGFSASRLMGNTGADQAPAQPVGPRLPTSSETEPTPANTSVDAEKGSEAKRPEDKERCPPLLDIAPEDRHRAVKAAERWARRHRSKEVRSFEVGVGRARGNPMGPCGRRVWTRTWVANVHWTYRGGSAANQSASLASSTIFIGQHEDRGWIIWFQFH